MAHRILSIINLIAFIAVIGFFILLQDVTQDLPVAVLLTILLAVCINFVSAALALYRFAAIRPEAARPTNWIALGIGLFYTATFILFEWVRLK